MTADPFAWARSGDAAKLLAILNEEGEARFVGGCIRDSLLGQPPGAAGHTDIDIATTLLPEETLKLLGRHGIRVIPTGLEHGTVTAVLSAVPFEITTLRCDVATDGRHATVSFTEDWEKDAARRDFTINALSLDKEGRLYDYHDGRADLMARRVRFIGRPAQRIKEDYLRILRFMRFSARFGGTLDVAGWQASEALAGGLLHLSKERIWSEVSRLFCAAGAPTVLSEAAKGPILDAIIQVAPDPVSFARIHAAREGAPSAGLCLAALWPTATRSMLQSAFKPPTSVLAHALTLPEIAKVWEAGATPREVLFSYGRPAAEEGLALCRLSAAAKAEIVRALTTAPVPVLPVRGADFIAAGLTAGPMVGNALKDFTERWAQANFPEDPAIVRSLFDEVMAAI
ncbi:possible poly(A) polymerase [Parvularcula bermudensis HTCC2503]|uniref:Possible poly(A) polymerase n=1 Tax=Parvularcula bermudensis (strain ATCC BAA-594 / HTCC2503 / KCTC 12087) TaxID=314260 RepID=E0TG67_PARBH|nr:CCA tRNA nucleotidyltransferase [Parvularcula bermudensis]ADM10638.1 possible poly(A) polymerase [Parvularcula bermudensis HTCC2503]